MPKARNIVIAGSYEGRPVSHSGKDAYIVLKRAELLHLTSENIALLELIDSDSDISVQSSAIRGLIGEMLLGPVGLLGAATAKRSERYILGMEFKDGKQSVVEIDEVLYGLIQAASR